MNPNILVLPKRRSAKRRFPQIRVSDSYGDEVFRLGSLRSKTAAFPLELDDGEVSGHRENSTKQLTKQEKKSERSKLNKAQR